MPELPEVEVTRRGLDALVGRRVTAVDVRERRLRWPVPRAVDALPGRRLRGVARRGKYLLLDFGDGHLIVHLGMSGSLRVLPARTPAAAHDHVDLRFGDAVLRMRDPRRFGAVLWTSAPPEAHPLLRHLGVEPLSPALTGAHLHRITRGARTAIKAFLMDAQRIVGVGNIYASESLFLAGIHPRTPAGRLSGARCARLAAAIRRTLRAAILAGGSSRRDYVRGDGTPGGFLLRAWVYERAGAPCRRCATPLRRITQGQRSTYFCPACQRW